MLWENLTVLDFEKSVEACDGVCILPIGVMEKHGNHLPLGTDMQIIRAVCEAAAKQEPVMLFPYYYMGQIAEARHFSGTIAPSHRLVMDSLLEMCDEIGRNGFKKILIMNGHGGNEFFLPFFAQQMPHLDRDYVVYTKFVAHATAGQYKKIAEKAGHEDMGDHAGILETALMMHLHPELVHMGEQSPDESEALGRLDDTKKTGLFSGYDWYADYPEHFAGDPTLATSELGEFILDIFVENTVKSIRAIKADDKSLQFASEYIEYGNKPRADRKFR